MARSVAAKPQRRGEEPRRSIPFFPDFALREALVALVVMVALLVLASVTSPSLEEEADPAATGYLPRPEWYFLWLFQSLKYFKGELEVVGTFVVPTMIFVLLFAVPFLDRGEPRARPLFPGTRPVTLWPRALGAAAMLGLGALTFVAARSESPMTPEAPKLTAVQAAGKALYDKMGCPTCHAVAGEGGDRGPDLTGFGAKPDADQRVLLHFTGVGADPASIMPGYQLSPEELRSLAAYLLSLEGG